MSEMASQQRAGGKTALSNMMYVTVIVTTWCLANLLLAFGIFFLLFLMLANASFLGFFTEINNLADRYLSAGSDAQRAFQSDVKRVLLILFILVGAVRFSSLLRSRKPDFIWYREERDVYVYHTK